MTDINKHPALRKLYEAALSLERLPASPEQTAAAILLADASRAVDALVDEVNRIQNVSIMSDFTFMAAQELREAVEPFRCDTFGTETPESERLDKACTALDRVHTNGLLKAAKDAEIARLKAEVARVTAQRDRLAKGAHRKISRLSIDSLEDEGNDFLRNYDLRIENGEVKEIEG